MLYSSHFEGECLARPLARPPSAGVDTPFQRSGGKKSQDMEAPPGIRSWGDYLLDALCIAMMLAAVTGMLYVLSHR